LSCARWSGANCKRDPGQALKYLQTQVSEVVDHSNAAESKDFRHLATHLFMAKEGNGESAREEDASGSGKEKVMIAMQRSTNELHLSADAIYERLMEYFPTKMKAPKHHLTDLIALIE
jgi:hypothetical protein